jgi:hypothetical protein
MKRTDHTGPGGQFRAWITWEFSRIIIFCAALAG